MRRMTLILTVAALSLLATLLLYRSPHVVRGQSGDSTQVPAGDSQSSTVHTLYCGLWRVDGGFVSTIRIKNSLVVAPLEMSPVLYMADGTEYVLPPIKLAETGVAALNVNAALAAAAPHVAEHLSQFGSAALRYGYSTPGHVLGSIEILDTARSLIFTYPFSGAADASHTGETWEGLWWRQNPGVGGFVSLANATGATLEVSIQPIGSRGTALTPEVFHLPAHATQMLDLDRLVGGLPGLENQAGGLRVQHNGPHGALLITGGLVDEFKGYSANMPFWVHDQSSSDAIRITYASVGLMVGPPDPSAGFPSGTQFGPYLALRNTTANPLDVGSTLNYMVGSTPKSVLLPPLKLRPYETRYFNLDGLFESTGLRNLPDSLNLSLTFVGLPGDLVVATGSVDQSGTYVFEVEPQGVGESLSKVAHYWKVADGFDSMFTLWNPTDQAQELAVTFFYADGSGKYELPLLLPPQASATMDMSKLIAAQQPDPEGRVIPPGVREGSATFSSAKGITEPMTLVISVGIFNVATATCGTPVCISCCGYVDFRINPDPLDVLVGTSAQANAEAKYCDGNWYPKTASCSWTSANTSIATVQTVGQSNPGRVTANAYGSTTISATFPQLTFNATICAVFPSCPQGTPQKSGTVRSRQAKWAVVVSDSGNVNGEDQCPFTPGAKKRTRFFEAYDDFDRIPFNEYWILQETGESCGATTGGEGFTVTFDDVNANCRTDCTTQLHQRLYIGRDKPEALTRQVKVKNCRTCAEHNGWLVNAIYNNVTIVDE